MSGSNFLDGVRNSLITSVLNHMGHIIQPEAAWLDYSEGVEVDVIKEATFLSVYDHAHFGAGTDFHVNAEELDLLLIS